LVPGGKNPITEHGYKDASKDREQIIKWWTDSPNANIGIPTGHINGFFCLDIDPRNGGHLELEELEDTYGSLPDTVEAETGRRDGGRHILFKQHEPLKKTVIGSGIDVQADSVYIVVAPSIHPDSKQRYVWEDSSHPLKIEIAEPPGWLMQLIKKPETEEYEPKPTEDYLEILGGVDDGNRNNSMMTLIGYLLAKKIDY